MKPRFGLIRSNEFIMKDLYTFDKDCEAALQTYQEVSDAYNKIFTRIGVPYQRVEGDNGNIGGTSSHEFHYPAGIGQDELLWCSACKWGKNIELNNDKQGSDECPGCGEKLKLSKGIEVGHTFLLGQKYSKIFGAQFTGAGGGGGGKAETLEMGCYGIGVSRILAAAVEVLSTETEIRWPSSLSPFSVCILTPKTGTKAYTGVDVDNLYEKINNIFPNDVLLDDREKLSVGKKQYEADRTGYPILVLLGRKNMNPDPLIEIHIPSENISLELRPQDGLDYLKSISAKYLI